MRPIHHVFDIGYSGVVRELRSRARIIDLLSGRSLELKHAIWDTGATSTALNSSIARAFGRVATGQTLAVTANGTAVVNTYIINLGLPQRVQIRGLNVMDGDLGDSTDLLIGMDVIAMGDFIVQNRAGKTHFFHATQVLLQEDSSEVLAGDRVLRLAGSFEQPDPAGDVLCPAAAGDKENAALVAAVLRPFIASPGEALASLAELIRRVLRALDDATGRRQGRLGGLVFAG